MGEGVDDEITRGLQIYRVGGFVRDTLLGLVPQDRDWVVVGRGPQEMLARGFVAVGKDFPVFLHPDTKEAYALARAIRRGRGNPGGDIVATPEVSLHDDLSRRDFTINAMAMDRDGAVVDPFGGRVDLERRVLRHVGPAFADDPLRVLRAARFAARLGFAIAPETQDLMRTIVTRGALAEIAPERVWVEVQKAMAGPAPAVFIRELRRSGALQVWMPEVAALDGVPQPPRHHPEIDTLVHVLSAVERAAALSPDPMVRFAVLLHDLGKGLSPQSQWPAHHGHEQAGVPLIDRLCARLRAPSAYHRLATQVCLHHLSAHRAAELRPQTIAQILHDLGALRAPQRLEPFLIACQADLQGRLGRESTPYPQADLLRTCLAAAAAVQSGPLLERGLSGPQLGAALHAERVGAIRRARTAWLGVQSAAADRV